VKRMSPLDDSILGAFVDGELGEAESRDIERRLTLDPPARQRVRAMQDATMLVRAAFPDAGYRDGSAALLRKMPHSRPAARWSRHYAIAAVLAVCAVFGAGAGLSRFSGSLGTPAVSDLPAHAESESERTLAGLMNEVAEYHPVYAADAEHLVEIGADRRGEIQAWLGRRLNIALRVPDLGPDGLAFRGVRLLAVAGAPVAQLVYVPERGAPIALCITPAAEGSLEPRFEHRDGLSLTGWSNDVLSFVVIGEIPEAEFMRIVADVIETAPRNFPHTS
jgi:anti-sigma factor RsiW